jgi:hypothetical protein
VWSRVGRGDLAWRWWERVDPDGVHGPWLAGARGLVLRELGLHREAQRLEEEGLRAAADLVDVVALRLSLAADAVGLGEASVARTRRDAAVDLLGELPDGPRVARQRLRRTWVDVELALLDGTTPPVEGLADVSTEGDVRHPPDAVHGTDFHRAKGLLFAAIARHRPELLAPAAALAPGALRWAVELARVDTGDARAGARAVGAWEAVVPPEPYARAARRTPTAKRLAALAATRH